MWSLLLFWAFLLPWDCLVPSAQRPHRPQRLWDFAPAAHLALQTKRAGLPQSVGPLVTPSHSPPHITPRNILLSAGRREYLALLVIAFLHMFLAKP